MHYLSALVLLLGFLSPLQGQSPARVTISGTIEDADSRELLLGATIYDQATGSGTVTNTYGFFSLTLPSGPAELTVSYIGYTSTVLRLDLLRDTSMVIRLLPGTQLEEVEVTADKVERISTKTQMSVVDVPVEFIKKVPALLGEVDVLKVIQLLPGVQSGGEGQSGFYVRGGGPDQNLILLDGVPVYNASHLFGFFSVFNADAVKDVTLYKGGFPARYGGRLSSVLDITLKEGNMQEYHSSLSLGLVASSAMVEGPIIKDKVSFIVTGRRTYIDLLIRPFLSSEDGIGGYYFHDVNAKINWRISDRDRVYLSTYTGRDKFYYRYEDRDGGSNYEENADIGWGNLTTALRWNHVWSPNLFSNTTLTLSDYTFDTDNRFKETEGSSLVSELKLAYTSGIRDWAGRIDFDYLPVPKHYIRYGAGVIAHTFKPGVFDLLNADEEDRISTSIGQPNISATEWFAYVEDDAEILPALKVNYGVHTSGFQVEDQHYVSVQPRISLRYLLREDLSLKASFSTMRQYINLLSNESIGLPTDLWLPATKRVKPQDAWQAALGAAYDWKEYEVSVEGYYKDMQNLLSYTEGSSFFSFSNWQNRVTQGMGDSYGVELFLQKKRGAWTGWIGYTLSRTNRQFDELNFGRKFPYKYDRRHDFEIVVNYKKSEKFDIGMTWVFGTGKAISLAAESYYYYSPGINPNSFYQYYVEHFEERNNFRMPSYHRGDIGFNFHKIRTGYQRTISFGAYNVYNRKNPFFVFTEETSNQVQLKQASLFPIIPFISYNIKF